MIIPWQELFREIEVASYGTAASRQFFVIGSVLRVLSPDSALARSMYNLGVASAGIFAVIFMIVVAIVVYGLMRARWREGEPDPEQYSGNRKIEIIWTAIPCVIVIVLFGLTAKAMRAADPAPPPAPDIVVTGHQWWWEMRYPKSGAVTANEMHIPVGKPVALELDSSDVLHEFWVPELGRKMTAVPGHPNHMWIEADHEGSYLGFCTEYCGTEHAWMHFLVVAEPPPAFEAWQATQLKAAPPVARGQNDADGGGRLFLQLSCPACHAIAGTAAAAQVGPNLTHFASRQQLAAGVLTNTPENLRRWLANPQNVKPGAFMPDFKLTDEQLTRLVAYLETLK